MAKKLLSDVKSKWKITPNFYGLLRQSELYIRFKCLDIEELSYKFIELSLLATFGARN